MNFSFNGIYCTKKISQPKGRFGPGAFETPKAQADKEKMSLSGNLWLIPLMLAKVRNGDDIPMLTPGDMEALQGTTGASGGHVEHPCLMDTDRCHVGFVLPSGQFHPNQIPENTMYPISCHYKNMVLALGRKGTCITWAGADDDDDDDDRQFCCTPAVCAGGKAEVYIAGMLKFTPCPGTRSRLQATGTLLLQQVGNLEAEIPKTLQYFPPLLPPGNNILPLQPGRSGTPFQPTAAVPPPAFCI